MPPSEPCNTSSNTSNAVASLPRFAGWLRARGVPSVPPVPDPAGSYCVSSPPAIPAADAGPRTCGISTCYAPTCTDCRPLPPKPRVETMLLEVIAEKTGYPTEMLDLDMAMDADLGIDSIKRVEILSALQERLPEAPQIKPEHLGTLHNLRDIAVFLAGRDATASSACVPTRSVGTGCSSLLKQYSWK